MKKTVFIDGQSLTLAETIHIINGAQILLSRDCKNKIDQSRKVVENAVSGKKPIYAINTGVGALASKKIPVKQLIDLQHNIIRSHASGWGNPIPIEEARLAQVLRLNVLAKGHSGVRWLLCERLEAHINANIVPLIPEYGSVGASGDLAPLAHLALPLIGEGSVFYKGKVIPAKEALKKTSIPSLRLKEKEGISLVNGTQVMLATGSFALNMGIGLALMADKICALTYEGMNAHTDTLDPDVHRLRGHPMQEASARSIVDSLEGSFLWDPQKERLRIQDAYSLRCAPQVHGASRSTLAYSASVLERELNAVTDNPIVFPDENTIISAGNFHGQPIALAMDAAAMAIAELGNISERRLDLMFNPAFSALPPFLAPASGTHSGLMAMQYLAGSLVNENKLLANPSCTDSIPGNLGIEDHVSMGATSARKLKKITENVSALLAVELIAAAQAVDLRKSKKIGKGAQLLYENLRKFVPTLKNDRILSEDIKVTTNLVIKFAQEIIKN